MSTSKHTDDQSCDTPPRRVFIDDVFENSAICSECLARIKRVDVTEDADGRTDTLTRRVAAGAWGHDETTHDHHGALRTHEGRTVCTDCGSIAGRAQPEPPSMRQLLAMGDRLGQRLDELGYDHNQFALEHAIRHLGCQPDRQGRERELLAAATAVAIRHADRVDPRS